MPNDPMHDEEYYAMVADELNDGSPDDCTLGDLDAEAVARAKAFAQALGFPWPPQVGDYDRYYEWRYARNQHEARTERTNR